MKFVKWSIVLMMVLSATVAQAEALNDKNINEFLYKYSERYFFHFTKLAEGFVRYKENNNYQGFVEFKNKEWGPNYSKDKLIYEQTFEDNRKYLLEHGLNTIVSNFFSLEMYANTLFSDLRTGDNGKRKLVNELLHRDALELQKLFKDRGLDINKTVKGTK